MVHDDGVFTVTIGPSSSGAASASVSDADASTTPAAPLVAPSPRMGCGLCVRHGQLYVYGGLVEDGDKQYTLNDMFSIGNHPIRHIHLSAVVSSNSFQPTRAVNDG